MKRLWIILLILGATLPAFSQQLSELTFEQFENQYLEAGNDTLYVLNFWATWCGPCVKELPEFEQVNKDCEESNVKVVLVSLDFPNQVESRLIPFIEKHNLMSRVVFLNAPGENEWIPKVSEQWDGTIPVTLFVMPKGSRKFVSGSMTYEKITSIIKTNIDSQ